MKDLQTASVIGVKETEKKNNIINNNIKQDSRITNTRANKKKYG